MKILQINCSPRPDSVTLSFSNQIIKGLRQSAENLEISYTNLYERNIKYCDGCLSCMKTNKCRIKDDASSLKEMCDTYDMVVCNIPHMGPGGIPAILKNFLERNCNQIWKDNLYIIAGCGFSNNKFFKEFLWKIPGVQQVIVIPQDILISSKKEDMRVKNLFNKLLKVGEAKFRVCQSTIEDIEKPLFSEEELNNFIKENFK